MVRVSIALVLVVLFMVASAGARDVYTWKDKNGVTHISDVPIQGAEQAPSLEEYDAQNPRQPLPKRPKRKPEEERYIRHLKELEDERVRNNRDFEVRQRALKQTLPQDQETDMTGVEWRQSRGSYSGSGTKSTRKEGFGSGKYTIVCTHRGWRYVGIWLRSRRGLNELLVNFVGSVLDSTHTVELEHPDEIWFDVESHGRWKITIERAR